MATDADGGAGEEARVMGKYDEDIERGMKVLDEHVPGWEWRINLRRLDLGSCERCVVGQLGGEDAWFVGVRALGIDAATQVWPVDLGMALDPPEYNEDEAPDYRSLTRAWRKAIRARLARAAAGGDG